MRPLPVGIDDFRQVREQYYFVDKSDFIRELLDRKNGVTLITRPRRFGKTLMLSMVESFFSIRRAGESEALFRGLAIEKAGSAYMSQRGQYPVIFLSFKDLRCRSWEEMIDGLRMFLSRLYHRFLFLLESGKLDAVSQQYFERILYRQGTLAEMAASLVELTEFLCSFYGRRVIVLIDEYDAPIQQAWEAGYYEDCLTFMRNFLSYGLKSNDALEWAVLTGVLRVAKESIFSGLNNLSVYSVLSPVYCRVFGFTPGEVKQIAADFGGREKLDEIRYWYDGYRFGGREVYNPWSVLRYFADGQHPMPYWVNSGYNGLLRELLMHADTDRLQTLHRLIEGQSIPVSLSGGTIYESIGRDKNALYSILLMTGYLTEAGAVPGSYERYFLKIPNEEIKEVYAQEILSHMADGLERGHFDALFDGLFSGRAADFARELQYILLHMASAYDTASKESFYHGLMRGMSAVFLGRRYVVESNRESGYGRFDIAIFPRDTTGTGVIMEFKAAPSEKELSVKAEEALRQIEDRKYRAAFEARRIRHVWTYGIAFCGRRTEVRMSGEDE